MKARSCAVLFAFAAFASIQAFSQKPSESFVSGEILVKFRAGTDGAAMKKANAILGAQTVERLGDLGWVRVKLGAAITVEKAVSRYTQFADVEAVQPNFYYALLNTPNDPQFTSPGMYGLSKISAPSAWDMTTGSSAVVVADIDTGMRYTHEDLAANVWTNPGEIPNNGVDDDGNGFIDDVHGYDFRFNDPDPADENGHGTHTAGTIGAAGNNLLGVVGVNWNVKIMPIKIYSAGAADSTSAMLVNAYNYVRLMKNRGVNIRVTNNSYGDCPEACGYDQATKDAIDALGDAGVLNVFAAGNANNNNDLSPFFPATYTSPSILAVAASDSNDNKAGFSSYGATTVDLAAPGLGILSTYFSSDSSYRALSGTSMATPHTAGAAALLSAWNPALSVASLKATLMNTVDPLANWVGVVKSGGRLNIANAMLNPTVCSYGLASTSINLPTKGGEFSVNVTAPQNCDFTAKSPVNWIHVSGADVISGSKTVTFRATFNPAITRATTLTIAGQTVQVRQSRVPGL
ncbi:MAG: S8 family serine peptidase, partial [Acidobacteriota bacterium]